MKCYFSYILDYPDAVVETLAHYINHPMFGRVDVIVGIGLSGTMPLMSLHKRTGLPVLALRKPNEQKNSHGADTWMPTRQCRYLIVDDKIDTGLTIRNIIKEMVGHECAGVLCYQQNNTPLLSCSYDFPIMGVGNIVREVDELMAEGLEP